MSDDDATIRSWPPLPPIDRGTLFDAALHVAAKTTAHIHLWQELCRAHCSCSTPVSLQQCDDCGQLRVLVGTEILTAPY